MTTAPLADTHAHLMDPAFDADRPEVLARARAAGVLGLVLVGYDLPTSRAAVALAESLDGACATVGIHPNAASSATEADFAALARLAQHPRVAAIGETGLDYYRDRTPPDVQRQAFARHLRLAEAHGLPVIVHNREADDDVAAGLEASAARRPADSPPGVLHCFSSRSSSYLQRMLDAGYFVSFAGNLTFKNAPDLRRAAARVPLDRLLVETDCPFMAPVPHRGRRNEPAFVRDTAACLADTHGAPSDSFDCVELENMLWRNSLRVFPSLARTPVAAS